MQRLGSFEIFETINWSTVVTVLNYGHRATIIIEMSNQAISHHLGTAVGWRSKRLKIAMALRSQGWSYQLISEYLLVTPKSLMRDIKCFVINPRNLPR